MSFDNNSYVLRFAAINGSWDTTVTVKKDTAFNLSFLSFSSKEQLQVEPPKTTWDIVFSQYTYIFYDQVPPLPYLVTGCLLNRYITQAVLDTTSQFSQINFNILSNYTLSSDISTIGYGWKTYNGSYTINDKYSYIVCNAEGIYYKMRFIGFYNANGVKGNPTWEYQQL